MDTMSKKIRFFCLKMVHISFFIASTCLGVFVQAASPSSLYNPTLTSRWVSWDDRNSPTSSQVEAIKKEICKIFKRNSLQITIEANKKVVDFLDITMDLRTEIYKPYKKPNSNLTYIHKQSNHPPSIIKNLPKSINRRLSTNSKNAQIFNESCPAYTEPLKKNGYNTNPQFDKTCTNKSNEKNKTRKRNITWFNPPFNINVATNVAKTFLSLIDKHFPKDKKLSKIFNRNTIKVSYSCLPNVKQTISNNNHRLLQLHHLKIANYITVGKKVLAHLTASASLNALYIKQQ